MDGQEVGDPGDFAGGQIVADDAVGPGEVGERGVAGGYGAEGRVGCGGEVHRPVTVVVDARDGVVGVVCDSRRCDDFVDFGLVRVIDGDGGVVVETDKELVLRRRVLRRCDKRDNDTYPR